MSKGQSQLFIEKDSVRYLSQFISKCSASGIFILVDENTLQHCYPVILRHLPVHYLILIKAGEENKTVQACEIIWEKLSLENADRNSFMINLGGGMIGDVGGFAA